MLYDFGYLVFWIKIYKIIEVMKGLVVIRELRSWRKGKSDYREMLYFLELLIYSSEYMIYL